MNSQHQTSTTPGTSRRAVVRGAAWSLPVIATAVAAPSAAASPSGPPNLTVTAPFIAWNYEPSKYCAHGAVGRPNEELGWIADGIVYTYNDALGKPLANQPITLTISRQNSGSFWFVQDPYASAGKPTVQLTTIVLTTDAQGKLALDSSTRDVSPNNWGYLRYGKGASNANLSLVATTASGQTQVLAISNGSEGNHPHPGNPPAYPYGSNIDPIASPC